MRFLKICNFLIEYSFYALFFLVPLVFTGSTSELFEFNKMWLTFILTIIITCSWLVKMIFKNRILIRRTPLDIPILLFLLSQIIATFHSLDTHVSLWGYYSRFNGGLLSIISYIILYYAFVSNFNFTMVKRLLFISLASGIIVSLWGLPSHFGYDPTCFLFRGNFDVSCWTNAFQPKVRIFSTLGQPDWLAAYLAVLLSISIAFLLIKFLNQKKGKKYILCVIGLSFIILLFYLDLIFTGSKSGFLGFWISIAAFLSALAFGFRKTLKSALPILAIFFGLLIVTFIAGQPFGELNKFTSVSIKNLFPAKTQSISKPAGPAASTGELGGTDSGKIRLIVWKGALDIWRHNPIFGTGVETFAFAYYKYKPKEHNLTSEWDFLYNKAHNEYLNYLATTGIFGLGSYLLMIGWFLFSIFRNLLFNIYYLKNHVEKSSILILALLAAYVSILISNFFGFSVVIINIYLFLIPAFVLILTNSIESSPSKNTENNSSLLSQSLIISVILISFYLIYSLIDFWVADTNYALGYNLDHANEYQTAYPLLVSAVSQRQDEPVFKDELSQNEATLALLFSQGKEATQASLLTNQAIALSNDIITNHPNNVVFWKSRTRVFYILSQIDPKYLYFAIQSLEKSFALAPTDVKISYDLGVLYGQVGNDKKAIEFLKHTIYIKPDYRDAYFALGLFYHQQAVDKTGKVIDPALQQKAIDQMQYILKNIAPTDTQAQDALKTWGIQ